jgi:hypothetical protein
MTPVTAAGDAPVTTKTGSTTGTTAPSPPNSKLVAGYWQMWQGPHVSEITANAPQYNLQYAAFAMGNCSGSGAVSFDPMLSTPQRLKADIAEARRTPPDLSSCEQYLRQRGRDVLRQELQLTRAWSRRV